MTKRGKNIKEHGQLSLFDEEMPKWLLKTNDQDFDPYRYTKKPDRENYAIDSYEDLDELGQFSDWLKREG